MNNWRLLLLAFVAVFHPISSFTDHLVDGRQQCCDRQSPTPLGDTRSSLHETYRLGKGSPVLRRLTDWDETREDQRYELRQRNSVTERRSTERSLANIREQDTRQARSVRVERQLGDQSRERLFDQRARERVVADDRRTSKDALGRQNDRTIISRRFSRNIRFNSFSNERPFNVFDSQRDVQRMLFWPEEGRFAQNRVRVARYVDERLSTNNMESPDRRLTRERIQMERRNVRDFRIINNMVTRNEKDAERQQREIRYDERLSSNNIETPDHRPTRERIQMERRNVRDFRIINDMVTRNEKNAERQQREIRYDERLSSNNMGTPDRRLTRERIQGERRNVRDFRIINNMVTRNEKDAERQQREIRYDERLSSNNVETPDRRFTRERIQMERRNVRDFRIINNMVTRNEKDAERQQREIRYDERLSSNNVETPDRRFTRERIQMERRNVRDFRIINNMVTRNEKDAERQQREIRYDERLSSNNLDTPDRGLIRERIQMERRNVRDFRIINNMVTRNEKDAERQQREIRYDERLSSNNVETPDRRLTRERIQMERRNVRGFIIISNMATRKERDIESRREIRFNERLSVEQRKNADSRLSRERDEMDRKNIHESRTMNNFNERDALNRGDIRYERLSRETREEFREYSDRKLARENRQVNRWDIRESRIIRSEKTRNERDVESRRENRLSTQIRDGQRNSESRVESRSLDRISVENVNRRDIRESEIIRSEKTRNERYVESRRENRLSTQIRDGQRNSERSVESRSLDRISVENVDRRNIRESRIIRSEKTRNERDVESRRENRLSTQIRDVRLNSERRVESRAHIRISVEKNDLASRRALSEDRRNFRAIKVEPKRSRSADSDRAMRDERRNKPENRERELESRTKHQEIRNRERTSSAMVTKMVSENYKTTATWQLALYTFQGAYLCALFMQMLTPSHSGKRHTITSLHWLPVF